MLASPTFVVHDGQLDTKEDLCEALGLNEGQKLFVVSSNEKEIVLRRDVDSAREISLKKADWMKAWESLRGILPNVRTPEWEAKADERVRLAHENIDRVYASKDSGATEIKQAERKLEFALDDRAGGPYPDQ